jgi:FAD:protein FMN transferase
LCYNNGGDKVKKIVLVILMTLIFTGCAPVTKDEYARYSNQTVEAGFDTLISMIAYTKTPQEFSEYFDLMKSEFYRYHQLFDKYNAYDGINNIYTINQYAGITPVTVDPVIIDMLILSKEWYEKSNFQFNVTLGAVLKVWSTYRDEGQILNSDGKPGELPPMELLEEKLVCTGWDYIEIDEEKRTVYITDSCASLDVGGVAKGYATELVAKKLESEGLSMAIINAGGNVRSIGTKPENEPWAVGIESPDMGGVASLDTIRLPESTSFVTSGDYQRYFIGPDNVTYHHLIDAETLMPATHFRAVTVISEDSGIADILSTTLFLLSYEEGVKVIEAMQQQYPDQVIGALWVFEENQIPQGLETVESGGYFIAISPSLVTYSRIFA